MLKAISDAIQYVIDMGASVMLPIVIPVISVCIGVKVGKAIRSGLMIGVGRFQLRSSGIMNRRNRCAVGEGICGSYRGRFSGRGDRHRPRSL